MTDINQYLQEQMHLAEIRDARKTRSFLMFEHSQFDTLYEQNQIKPLSGATLTVYLVVLSYMNTGTMEYPGIPTAWCGMSKIMKKTGFSRSTVKRAIKDLVARKMLIKHTRIQPRRTNVYHMKGCTCYACQAQRIKEAR